jgi:hypothetical protein
MDGDVAGAVAGATVADVEVVEFFADVVLPDAEAFVVGAFADVLDAAEGAVVADMVGAAAGGVAGGGAAGGAGAAGVLEDPGFPFARGTAGGLGTRSGPTGIVGGRGAFGSNPCLASSTGGYARFVTGYSALGTELRPISPSGICTWGPPPG